MTSKIDPLEASNDILTQRVLCVINSSESEVKFVQVLKDKGLITIVTTASELRKHLNNPYDLACIFSYSLNLEVEELKILFQNFENSYIPCISLDIDPLIFNSENIESNIEHVSKNISLPEFLVKVSIILRLRKTRLDIISQQIDIMSENSELRALTSQLRHDLEEAKEIHAKLLPSRIPKLPSGDIGAFYLPLEALGGDIYDIWETSDNKIAFFIGDVTGHGLAAAFIGAMIKIIIHSETMKSPAQLLSNLDLAMSKYLPESRFATAICMELDTQTSKLTIARAGHLPAILYSKKTNSISTIEPKGPPLTLGTIIPFEEMVLDLLPGDRLLLFTDGFSEAMNMSGTLWGISGLSEELRGLSQLESATDILLSLYKSMNDFTEGRLIKDDLTALAICR